MDLVIEGMVKVDIYLQGKNTKEVELGTVALKFKSGNWGIWWGNKKGVKCSAM